MLTHHEGSLSECHLVVVEAHISVMIGVQHDNGTATLSGIGVDVGRCGLIKWGVFGTTRMVVSSPAMQSIYGC
jgi:hypothetical protein